MRRLIVLAVLASLFIGPWGRLGPPAFAAADVDPAQSVYMALAEPDRRAVQDALIWTGDYAGIVSGTYGPRTRDALASYAGKQGLSPAAMLGPGARKALLTAAQTLRQAVGFGPVRDPRTAFVLSLPLRLLGKEVATGTGTRYSSPDSALVVDTLSRPAGQDGLKEIFDRMSTASATRKIVYKLMRDDFFVVSGEIGDRKFYSRYVYGTAGEAGLVRGFTFSYPKDSASRLDSISLAVAASFDPFPGSAAPGVAPATGAGNAPASGSAASAAVLPPKPAVPPGADAQAVMVAPGIALTVLTSRNCPSPSLDKVAAKFRAEDAASGLALLDVAGRAGTPVTLAAGGMVDGAALVALFNGKTGGLYAAPGEAHRPGPNGFALNAPLQSDSRGTPVFDRQGALVGVTSPSKTPPAIAGTLLQADYRVSGAVPIAKLLDQAGIAHDGAAATASMSFGDIVEARGPLVGTVSCGQ